MVNGRSREVRLYDTTLRDGTQGEGISLSVHDKLRIAIELDGLGIDYIEGGWPGSNPKDVEFFEQAAKRSWQHARIAAFGSTRRAGTRCEEDANLQALLAAETPVVTIVGKSSVLHVERVLETSREENLAMISESVSFLKAEGREVIYDAEHFFDGYHLDPEYALDAIEAAALAGADTVVLCDTNGGSRPDQVAGIVSAARARVSAQLGVHTHNDGALAVANAMAAVQAGVVQVQGTINGYGERCGNMDLVPLIANLQLKLGYDCLSEAQLRRLTEVSQLVAAVANMSPDTSAPYVGRSAFAHKGGIHVAAVGKLKESYEHVPPETVGNETRIVVSELSGRQNVRLRAKSLGLTLEGQERVLLERIKELESQGFQFEAAEGSFEMLVRRSSPTYRAPFELLEYRVIDDEGHRAKPRVQATVKLRVDGAIVHMVEEGIGPVNALDRAIRKALLPVYPQLEEMRLADYKVRIVDSHLGTAALTRVLIESARGEERWSTVGCSANIIEASWMALWDSYELPLLRGQAQEREKVEAAV